MRHDHVKQSHASRGYDEKYCQHSVSEIRADRLLWVNELEYQSGQPLNASCCQHNKDGITICVAAIFKQQIQHPKQDQRQQKEHVDCPNSDDQIRCPGIHAGIPIPCAVDEEMPYAKAD